MNTEVSIHVYDAFKRDLQGLCRELGVYYGGVEILIREDMLVSRLKTGRIDMTVCMDIAQENDRPTTEDTSRMDWRETRRLQAAAVQKGLAELAAINAREKAQLNAELTANQEFESEQARLQAERFKGYADLSAEYDQLEKAEKAGKLTSHGKRRMEELTVDMWNRVGAIAEEARSTEPTVDRMTTEEFATTLRVLVRGAEYELARDNHEGVACFLTTIRKRLEEFAGPTEPALRRCERCGLLTLEMERTCVLCDGRATR